MDAFDGASPLLSAARALQGTEEADIILQINFVSNALVQGHRDRRVDVEDRGFPKEARNVLENIKIQIEHVLIPSLNFEKSDQAFHKISQALMVIESFTDRVIQHFQVSNMKVSQEVKELLTRAKFEVDSTLLLKQLHVDIQTLRNEYLDNPQTSVSHFQERLQKISDAIRSVKIRLLTEKEISPDEPSSILNHINILKKELQEAFALSNLPEHPKIVGEMALNLLRVASDMVQQAKDQFVIQQALEMAANANKDLERSSEAFKLSAVKFNRIIRAKIASFVNRQIVALEKEVKKPVICLPTDFEKNEYILRTMQRQKERMITYFIMAKEWSGHRQEDFLERLALLFETITDRAKKMHQLLLEVVDSTENDNEKERFSRQAVKCQRLAKLGSETIKPDEIFTPSRSYTHSNSRIGFGQCEISPD
ncbi:MAG: hypothetical protein WB791_03175 [Waddliaceae bacterium]